MTGQNVPITSDWNEEDTLDRHHTHFLLLDDRPRSDFVDAMYKISKCQALTVIIEGSGHVANVSSTLIDVSLIDLTSVFFYLVIMESMINLPHLFLNSDLKRKTVKKDLYRAQEKF